MRQVKDSVSPRLSTCSSRVHSISAIARQAAASPTAVKIYVPALEYEIKCFLSRGKGLCWKLFLMRISGRIDVRGILHRQVIKPAQQLQPCGVRLYNLFSYWGTKGMDEIFDLRQQQMTPNSKCASITRLPLNERIHRPFFDWEIVKKKKTFFLSPFVLGLFLFTSPGPI